MGRSDAGLVQGQGRGRLWGEAGAASRFGSGAWQGKGRCVWGLAMAGEGPREVIGPGLVQGLLLLLLLLLLLSCCCGLDWRAFLVGAWIGAGLVAAAAVAAVAELLL